MHPNLPHLLNALLVFLFVALLVLAIPDYNKVEPTELSLSPPVAVDDGPIDVHGPSFRLDQIIFANDTGTAPLQLDIIGQNPSHGSLSFGDGTQVIYNVTSYVGPDSFTYRIYNSEGSSNFATVTLNVVNQAPVIDPDLYEIRGSQQLLPGVISNDSDPDPEDYVLFDIVVQYPTHGSLSLGGNGTDIIYYTPDPGYTGLDNFTYKITDNLALRSEVGTVTLRVIGDGENRGTTECPSRISVGGPVNVSNGNMWLQQTDYSLTGAGPAIQLERTYNSQSSTAGLFGKGWSTIYDEALVSYDNDFKRLNEADGRATYFGRAVGSSGPFLPLEGDFYGQLTQTAGGYTLTMKDGSTHQFNTAGKLLSISDRNGNQTTLQYNISGKLSSVTDPLAVCSGSSSTSMAA